MIKQKKNKKKTIQPRKGSKKGKVKRLDIQEHLMSIEDVCRLHSTDIDIKRPGSSNGLRAGVATERLAIFGPNILTPPKKKHWIIKFLECLLSLFNILLLLAGLATYILFIMDPIDNYQNVGNQKFFCFLGGGGLLLCVSSTWKCNNKKVLYRCYFVWGSIFEQLYRVLSVAKECFSARVVYGKNKNVVKMISEKLIIILCRI